MFKVHTYDEEKGSTFDSSSTYSPSLAVEPLQSNNNDDSPSNFVSDLTCM
jgi:hypothetical protein